ncbi:MAG: rhomboid family intramembrane serine protease [Thermoflexibacter sp.]|jgi:membrane associated rhomboid family serine protease|nr:rhomboid family intramembrane serine protease [Thermoflexibacter sp.]
MNALTQEFKDVWRKPNNALMQIIVLNIIIFAVINLVWVVMVVIGQGKSFSEFTQFFYMPAEFGDFIWRPWTLFTYFFTHQNPLHILFNMLILYWFGVIVRDYLGNSKVIALYIFGGIVGGLLQLLCFNTIPYFVKLNPELGIIGSDAAMYGVVIGAATYRPRLELHLLLFGAIKIVYIAAAIVLLSLIGVASYSSDAGLATNVTKIGGVLIGYIFVKQYEKGRDWSMPVMNLLNWASNLFRKRTTPKTNYAKANNQKTSSHKSKGAYSPNPSQEDIDAILDKISAHGYESLTTEEKQILFKASQKK